MEREGGFTRSVTNRYENFKGRVCGGLHHARYVTEKYKYLQLLHRSFNIFSEYAFKTASKCPIAIAFKNLCTFISIMMTYTYYAYMLLKLWRTTFRFKVQHILLKSLLNGGSKRGEGQIWIYRYEA